MSWMEMFVSVPTLQTRVVSNWRSGDAAEEEETSESGSELHDERLTKR